MKKIYTAARRISILLFGILTATEISAQTTITTTFANNNGNAEITFNFQNTNAFPIKITEIGSITGTSGSVPVQAWYNTTPVNTATAPPPVTNANGWTQFGSATITGIANTTTSTAQTFMTGLSLVIPAGTTYGIAIGATGLRYSSLTAGSYTVSGGGCNILTGTNQGWAGPAIPGNFANNDRGFIGYVTFEPFGPCTNPPTPGAVTSTSNPVCTASNFTLSLTGGTGGAGQTYQWESSTDNVSFSPVAGGTNATLTTTQSVSTYYRAAVTCGVTVRSSSLLVNTPAAVSGTFTINSAVATGGTNFQTFTDAINYIKCGINGPVVFNVNAASGPYSEQVTIPQVGGASAINTITFNGNGRSLSFNSTNTNVRAGIVLDGADYVKIDNLIIDGTAGTYGWGVQLINQADNNTISNCTINVSTSNVTAYNFLGIAIGGSATTPISAGNAGNNNTIFGNTIAGGYYPIILYGNSAAPFNTGNIISNNIIQDAYSYSIYLYGNINTTVSRNDITRPTRAASTTTAGVFINTGCAAVLIEKNRIHNMFDAFSTSTSATYGIYDGADATSGTENKIVNNLIYNIGGNGIVYGVYNTGGDYMQVYHNTIALDDQAATTGAAYGIYQTTAATGLAYRNNVVYVTRSGTGVKRCIYFVTTTSTITCNNNDLYMNSGAGTDNKVGQFGTTSYTTLTDWKGANSGAYDQQSFDLDPVFSNPGAGDYKPTSSLLDNKGINVGVTTDIGGVNRDPATPDIGAYEFTTITVGLNMAAEALITPAVSASGCYTNAETVTIRIRNLSSSTIDFSANPVTVTTNVTGAVTQTLTKVLNSGTLASNTTMDVVMTQTLDMTTPGTYTFNANTSVAGDVNPSNDAMPAVTHTKVSLTAGTVSVAPDSYCAPSPSNPILSSAGVSGYSSLQWQQSTTSGSGFTNITGGTTAPYTVQGALTQTMYYKLIATCGANNAVSGEVMVTYNNPQILTSTPGSRCGSGTVNLGATASAGYIVKWYDVSSGGSALATGNNFTSPVITSTTTYYASAASSGGSSSVTPMPVQSSTNTNTVRGYWFTAPISFKITGLMDLGTGTGPQSIAVVRFNPSVTPPTFGATTNAFTTLFLTQINPATGVIPVNIQINAGDVIGVLGQRGTGTTAITSYGSPNPYTTTIAGQSVALNRMGMQFALTTNTPQELWQEPTSTFIGRIEMTYETGCEGSRTAVTATVNPVSNTLAGSAGGQQVCSNTSVGAGNTYTDASCNPIATLMPSGNNPVTGNVNTCVKIDGTVQLYNGQPYVQRHYDIEPATNAANATATVTLYFTQGEFDAYNAANGLYPDLPSSSTDNAGKSRLFISQYHGMATGPSPANYPGPAVGIDPADANIVWNANASRWEVTFTVTGFSGFYVTTGAAAGPLPVTLLSFNAQRSGTVNNLTWSTSQEINTSHFVIERSPDGRNFTEIGQVTAAGNSSTTRNYQFTDGSPVKGMNYYRLRITDRDNNWKYSEVRIVRNSGNADFTIYPNPVKDVMKVEIDVERNDKGVMTITDVSGKQVYSREIKVTSGNNIIDVDISNMASGSYIIKVELSEDMVVKKFNKM